MNVNLLILTVLFAVMYVFAASNIIHRDISNALGWTAAILTFVAFLRTKPLDKLK